MNNKIDIYEAHNIDSLLILKIDDNSLFIKSIYFRNRPFISYLNPFIQIEALKRK